MLLAADDEPEDGLVDEAVDDEDAEDGEVSLDLPSELLLLAAGALLDEEPRLSVRYNPEPLKTTPTAENTLRSRPLQAGHTVSASSLNFCTASRPSPHSVHWY